MKTFKSCLALIFLTIAFSQANAEIARHQILHFAGQYELLSGTELCPEKLGIEATKSGLSFGSVGHGVVWFEDINEGYSSRWSESLRGKFCYMASLDEDGLILDQFKGGGPVFIPCPLLVKTFRKLKFDPESNRLEYIYNNVEGTVSMTCLFQKIE